MKDKDKEKYGNIRAFVVLLAALITQLLNIKYKRDIVEGLLLLIIVIAVFFVIASVAIKLIDKIKNMEKGKRLEIRPIPEEKDEES